MTAKLRNGQAPKRLMELMTGAALALVLGACSPEKAAEPVAVAVASADWPKLVDEWIADDFKANPGTAVYQGKHEYDGVLADVSQTGITAEIARLHGWKTKVEAVDPATLDGAQKFERDCFLANVDKSLFFLEDADWPHKNPTFYSIDPGVYLDRPYADAATRMKAVTKWASNVPRYLESAKANLKGPLPASYVRMGINSFAPLADFMTKDVAAIFKGVGDEAAQADFIKETATAAAAFADFGKYLETLKPTQTEAFAMGPELFSKMLYATERVDTPLAELERIGREDLKRNQDAMAEACKTYAPGKTIMQCVEKASANKPEGGVVEYAKKQLVDLRKFVIDHDVVSVPGTEIADVKASPPYNAQNGAYIDIPGPYEVNMPSFYNISPPDPSWSKKEQLDYISGKANLLFTSVHEVWPGHFLQFLHANRSKSIFGRIYVGYAFAEGWAHYTEEMMWDEGLGAGDAETHIGQLYNATLRNVRFISAIGMHTQGMTQAQSEKMFVEDGYQDAGTAKQQAARGTYDPAYLNYTMGKLLIRKLRDDWCAAHAELVKDGDVKTCWKPFHDAFLAYGGPPIPLVRGAMMNEPAKAVF